MIQRHLSKILKPLLLALAPGLAGAAIGAEVPAPDESRFLSRVRQLTYEGRRAGEGYFAPDGRALIFQSEREEENPFYQIYILDLANGDTTRVSPGTGKTTCAFFRPGTDEVLFASTHRDPKAQTKQEEELEFRASGKQRRYSWDYDEQMEIFSARRDGSGLKRLTEAYGYDAEGAYSPDGSKIVFCSLRDAYPEENLSPKERQTLRLNPSYFGEIYIMDADGSNQKRLTSTPGYDGGPFFSPDGRRIIWRRFNEKGDKSDIHTMKIDGSDVRRLTDFDAMSWAPYFHPSGDYAIFASNKLGFDNFELYLVDAAGSREPVRVTTTEKFDGLPVFSPDGKQLCWTSTRTPNGRSQLFLAQWNHDAAAQALAQAPRRSGAAGDAPATGLPARPKALSDDITADDVRAHVTFLADDALEGRLTGTRGARAASEYIAGQLERSGLKPAGDKGAWFHSFEFNQGAELVPERNRLTLGLKSETEAKTFEPGKDFQPLAFSANGEATGEVVFGGYGLALPDDEGGFRDPYGGTEVTNKIVLLLRYTPEDIEPKRKAELNRYAGLYYKAKVAQQRGARAVLLVTGPNSPNAGELIGLSSDSSLGGMIAASITDQVAAALLEPTGKTLKELQTALDTENPHAENGIEIKGLEVTLRTALKRLRQSDRNVLGIVPPSGPEGDSEYILLGAHYDHLGYGNQNSFQRKGEENQIHNGADDNASGVAALLELAAHLAAERRREPGKFSRGIVFGFWSGEEMGLLGSARFAENPTVPLERIKAYLNFDMVGRLRDNQLLLQGVGSSEAWRGLIERRNVVAGFNLKLQDDPYLPTDATSFYARKIPVLAFFTGSHDDYHRPSDDIDTLNYEGAERITRFANLLLRDLAAGNATPDYVKVERSKTGGMRGLRVYLGTIPDYAAEVEGLRLSGVRAGGPADKAGLKGGDVVIEFAGIKVGNIEDYMVAFNAVKIGKPASVIVLRDGKKTELTIVPEGRK